MQFVDWAFRVGDAERTEKAFSAHFREHFKKTSGSAWNWIKGIRDGIGGAGICVSSVGTVADTHGVFCVVGPKGRAVMLI